jgi:hypothetical protein
VTVLALATLGQHDTNRNDPISVLPTMVAIFLIIDMYKNRKHLKTHLHWQHLLVRMPATATHDYSPWPPWVAGQGQDHFYLCQVAPRWPTHVVMCRCHRHLSDIDIEIRLECRCLQKYFHI